MRTLALFALSMAVSAAQGSTSKITPAKCPGSAKLTYLCVSAPKKGDHEMVIRAFDSIAICSRGQATIMAVKSGHEQIVHPAKADFRRAGSAIYSLTAKDIEFQLSITTGIAATSKIPSRLSFHYQAADMQASSSYSCDKAK